MIRPVSLLASISVVFVATFALSVFAAAAAEVKQISPEELLKLIERRDPNIVVVDNQPPAAYALGHIKGAINFPWARDIMSPGNLPRDKMLILYCDCGGGEGVEVFGTLDGKLDSCSAEDDSTDVAEQLMRKFGYTDIRTLSGGWSKWQQLGYPVEKP